MYDFGKAGSAKPMGSRLNERTRAMQMLRHPKTRGPQSFYDHTLRNVIHTGLGSEERDLPAILVSCVKFPFV